MGGPGQGTGPTYPIIIVGGGATPKIGNIALHNLPRNIPFPKEDVGWANAVETKNAHCFGKVNHRYKILYIVYK